MIEVKAINEPELVHRLLVLEHRPDDPYDGMDIIHDPDCPYFPGDDVFPAQYQCAVHLEISNAGLDSFFIHKGDAENAGWGRVEELEPGLYEIEHWVENTVRDGPWGPAEWESGLRTVDHPRDPHPGINGALPAREESHQLWAWMRGAPTPHYEIVGTGALIDDETRVEMERRRELLRLTHAEDVVFRTETSDWFAIDLMRDDTSGKWIICLEDVNK